jgi:nitrate/nitrite transporter NarK
MADVSKNLSSKKNPSKWLVIFCLIFAGELIFSLPFHVIRYFRPTFHEVFDLSYAQLGDVIAIYGVTAMLCYFPGGIIADRFSTRKIMAMSLVATALGGIWMATIPGQLGLTMLFAYWGITNVLLFWSAMLRATRNWGGKFEQGRAFGILDGGRGLLSAGLASLAVVLLANLLPTDVESATFVERKFALTSIIWYYSFLTFLAAIVVWILIPENNVLKEYKNPFEGIKEVITKRSTWLQGIIIISAYCGYRGIDFYGLYATDILGMDEVKAARFVSNGTYLRPVAAIAAGFLADKFSTKKVILITFLLLALSYSALIFLSVNPALFAFIIGNLVFSFLVVYALRGIYFALAEETQVKNHLTGTTIGVVSFIGFTPDIFFNSVVGRILDASPGIKGYQNFYWLLIVFTLIGLLASFVLLKTYTKPSDKK